MKEVNDLKMYTREEVGELIRAHKDTVVMLSEVGCLLATKIGKRYMYSYESIKKFQHDYAGLDVSNRLKAIKSKEIVTNRQNNVSSGL